MGRVALLRLGTLSFFAWALSSGVFRLGTFACELSVGDVRYSRLGTVALFRSGTLVWGFSLENFSLGISVWELSFGSLSLRSLGNFRDRSFGNFRVGPVAWGSCSETVVWKLLFGIVKVVIAWAYSCSFAWNFQVESFACKLKRRKCHLAILA